ncbi:UNVERIFIED_ORG: hypothetical protein ABID57_000675 [Arthrobacter sp. UYEF1]
MKTAPHLCIKKFSWSWRPRLYIHYYDHERGYMVHIGIFRSENDLHPGINGCHRPTMKNAYNDIIKEKKQ